MLIAAACASLAQWQAGRSVEAPIHAEETDAKAIANAPDISTVVRPGRSPRSSAVGTLVSVRATINSSDVWVIGNRVQSDGTSGYWVVASYTDSSGNRLVAPLGFTANSATAIAVKKQVQGAMVAQVLSLMHGRLSPSEAPDRVGEVLNSLSLGQLANQMHFGGDKLYPLFLLVTNQHFAGLEPVRVTRLTTAQINWLSAFYALEWLAFCGFSFFMWGRLVRDAQLKEIEEMTANDR